VQHAIQILKQEVIPAADAMGARFQEASRGLWQDFYTRGMIAPGHTPARRARMALEVLQGHTPPISLRGDHYAVFDGLKSYQGNRREKVDD